MPLYFSEVAPHCPITRDQPLGPMTAPRIRTTIPRAHDLPSAIAAVNILRSIVIDIVSAKIRNNVFSKPAPQPRQPGADKTIDRQRKSRWVEMKELRITRRYKYYGKDKNSPEGEDDTDVWVETERIELMVWYDRAWKTYLIWSYGDKGEGELVEPVANIGGINVPVPT